MKLKTRDTTDMTLSNVATPFGCCNFFDHCTEEIMTLHYAGQLPLLDWMSFNVSNECYRSVEFITYVRPDRTWMVAPGMQEQMRFIQVPTAGHIADACADPHGIEWGSCKLTVEDFGRYGRMGPTRAIMQPKLWCKTDPRRRLDGSPVTTEMEWDQRFVTDVILQDISSAVITGNAASAGMFDGLEQWVATDYECNPLNSIVINWNGNPMAGGNGITWNGAAIANTFDFIDVLLAAYRRIRQRISWSPVLRNQQMRLGDMIILMPTSMIPCLLDFFTCWSVCADSDDNGNFGVAILSYEARAFRDQLLGGLFGFGQITIEGFPIPILGYDYELIKGPHTGDIYLLTGSIGGVRIWEGEHLSADEAAAQFGDVGYWSSDGGRILWYKAVDNECYHLKGWMHPRLFCLAPWAQVRFQSVRCEVPGGFLSADPEDTSFYPETSFSVAECP
jgi:hypothetical protein